MNDRVNIGSFVPMGKKRTINKYLTQVSDMHTELFRDVVY